MVRRIIEIDREKCNGCGACAAACHEGAIGMVNGKAVLLRDDYCDGLGDCLPTCPTGAITFVEREAAAYDEAAVLAKRAAALKDTAPAAPGGCPGSMARSLHTDAAPAGVSGGPVSRLGQWPIQIKLLRVLQSKKFMRIGGTKSIYSNFRLVCATNRDLRRSVAEGTFREDLYYRINVVTIRIPPLRERREDIVRLARHFLRYYAEHHNVAVPELTGEELERIASWSWPGNVRQLKNYMERFCILKDGVLEELGGTAGGAESPAAGQDSPVPGLLTGTLSLKELEDAYFESIYRKTAGEVGGEGGIAAILGISRSTAYAWIDRLRLRERYHRELRRNDDAG